MSEESGLNQHPPGLQKAEQTASDPLSLMPEEVVTILDAETHGICVTSPDGICRFVSQPLCDLLGYSRDEMLDFPVRRFLPPLESHFSSHRRRKVWSGEYQIPRKNGRAFPGRVLILELSAASESTGFAFFVYDLSEEKHIDEVLQKTERLASAGRMAAAIAHEINNPLEAVTNLLFILRNQDLKAETTHLLSLAETEIGRVSRIARQTLSFYRETGKIMSVDLRELLNLSVDVQGVRKPEMRIHRRYRAVPTVSGYASELQQVFHNMVANSVEAGATDLWIHLNRSGSSVPPYRSGVRITIGDNGCGIDLAVRSRMFSPFITTKGDKGTGLGLWVSRGIILRHEGNIRVRTSTRPGHSGTCMLIFLPR